MDRNALIYRRGRLQLPRDIAEWTPREVADWFGVLPPVDRVRAFRALPFSQAAAAFFAMEPEERAVLLGELNRNNRNRLVGLTGTDALAETLQRADPATRAVILEDIPPHRRAAVGERMQALEAAEQPNPPAPRPRRAWSNPLGRLVGGTRWRRRKPAA